MSLRESDFEPNNEESKFEAFKEEIRKIREEEERGERVSKHLAAIEGHPGLSEDELTLEDMEFWEKIKQGNFDKEEFFEKKRKVYQEGNASRIVFWDFLANVIGSMVKLSDGRWVRWHDLTPEQKKEYLRQQKTR